MAAFGDFPGETVCEDAYPVSSANVSPRRSSSLYAGITTDRDFVASEKIDGGGTCAAHQA